MSKRIGLMIYTTSSYGRGLVRGVAKYAHSHADWTLIADPSWQLHIAPARSWKVDGMIVQASQHPVTRLIRSRDLPAVNVADLRLDVGLPSVYSNNDTVGRIAAEHFIDRGFKQFAFCGFAGHGYSDRRAESFAKTVAEAGFECHFPPQGPSQFTYDEAPAMLGAWLASLPKPVGLMGCNDLRARQMVDACKNQGIKVPEDVAVVGVDNDDLVCELSEVPLSSVALNTEGIGYEASRMLDDLLHGRDVPDEPVLVEPVGLVTRRSSDILAIDDPEVAEAMRYIMNHAGERISVENVLSELAVSRRSLERRFRKLLGRSPSAEIRRAHIDRAKRMLRETDLPMPKVAQASGFTDAVRFSKTFRREVGQTPSDYRNESRLR